MPKAVVDGSSTASVNLASCLAETFDIDLVSLRLRGNEDELAARLTPPFSSVTLVTPNNLPSLARRAAYRIGYGISSRLRGIPRAVLYESCRNVRRTLARMASERRYDLVHLEYWTTSPLLQLPINAPKVIYFHDATYRTFEQLAETETEPRARDRFVCQAKSIQTYERQAGRGADAAHFISEEDRLALKGAGAVRSAHVPLLLPELPSTARDLTKSSHALFLGRFEHWPNVQAAQWLIERVVPLVRASFPSVKFRIAGPGMSDQMRARLSVPNVELLGWVEDLPALYQDTAVVVAPLQAGTGVSVKVLEAMHQRIPLVTTSIGARATPAASGAAIIADDPEAFANGITRLLGSESMRLDFSDRAFEQLRRGHMSLEARDRVKDAFLSVMLSHATV